MTKKSARIHTTTKNQILCDVREASKAEKQGASCELKVASQPQPEQCASQKQHITTDAKTPTAALTDANFKDEVFDEFTRKR